MKKYVMRIVACLLVFCGLATVCSGTQENVIVYEDGSYVVVTIENDYLRTTGTKTGRKVWSFYGNDDELKWKVTLQGTFTYNGTSAVCDSANVTVNIADSAWYTVSENSSKSGNTAQASVVMGRRLLGVTVKKETASLTLSCDKNGTLS